MAHLPRWGSAFVLSPENLSAFLDWFALQPQDVQLAHCKLFVVEHRDSSMIQHFRKVPPALMWGRDQSQNPVVTEMETRPCDVENCWRCTSEVGGYVFRWIGPWSCMEAVRLAEEVGFGPANRLAVEKKWRECTTCHYCASRTRTARTTGRYGPGKTTPHVRVDPIVSDGSLP